MINIWHDIDPSRVTPESFTAVIEIPAGSKKKYELDKQTGLLRLDRILYTSTHYPANYGFIPRTYAGDGDPLDVLVLCSETLDPMVEVDCYPIGVIRMIDDDEIDDKIIAIPFEDPNWNYYHDIDQLPPHHGNEIAHFFEIYKSLEHKYTATSDALTRSVAVKVIKECIERYEVHYCGMSRRKSASRKKRRKPRRRKSSLRISAKAKYIKPRTAFASTSGVTRVSPRSFSCSLGETVRLMRHSLYEKTQPSKWMAVFFWSRVRESNPPLWLGKRPFYR